jgi:hypothetical protein
MSSPHADQSNNGQDDTQLTTVRPSIVASATTGLTLDSFQFSGLLSGAKNFPEAIEIMESLTEDERIEHAPQLLDLGEGWGTSIVLEARNMIIALEKTFQQPKNFKALELEENYPVLNGMRTAGDKVAQTKQNVATNLKLKWNLDPHEFPYYAWSQQTHENAKQINAFVNREGMSDRAAGIAQLARNIVYRKLHENDVRGAKGDSLGPAVTDFKRGSSVFKAMAEVNKIRLHSPEVVQLLADNNRMYDSLGFIIPIPPVIAGAAARAEIDSPDQSTPRSQLAISDKSGSQSPSRFRVPAKHFPEVSADEEDEDEDLGAQTARQVSVVLNSPWSPTGRGTPPDNAGSPSAPHAPKKSAKTFGLSIQSKDSSAIEEEDEYVRDGDNEEEGDGSSEFEPDTPMPEVKSKSKGKNKAADRGDEIKAVCASCHYNPAAEFVKYLDNSKKYKLASQESLDNLLLPFNDLMEQYKADVPAAKQKGARLAPICRRHLKKLIHAGGLKNNHKTDMGLRQLKHISNNFSTVEQYREWMMRHPGDFVKGVLPADYIMARAQLGPYRFFHELEEISECFTPEQVAHLSKISGLQSYISEIRDQGSVIIPDMFSWAKVNSPEDEAAGLPTVWSCMMEEMDMYLWHQREIGSAPNLSWLRNMFHSNMQQLIRQDVPYWVSYCLAREDSRYMMVSYPYYAKYQIGPEGGRTENNIGPGFQHIDLNPGAMLEGEGIHQIQGSVSFDDESPNDCTYMVMGMHHREKLKLWVELMRKRGVLNDKNLIMVIDDLKNLTKSDLKALGLHWEPQACSSGGVRLTYPQIPHGAHEGKALRRTMLPWFCGLHGEHIDHEDAGTFDELSVAHRDLVPGPSSPSSYSNHYGGITYAFPAAVRLVSDNPISNSLIAQARWSSSEVQDEIKKVLALPDAEAYQAYVDQFHKQMVVAYRKAFEKSKALELAKFPVKGFYANQRNWELLAKPDELPYEKGVFNPISVEHDEQAKEAAAAHGKAFGHY